MFSITAFEGIVPIKFWNTSESLKALLNTLVKAISCDTLAPPNVGSRTD